MSTDELAFRDLIARSSLGTPEAVTARASVSDEDARRVVELSETAIFGCACNEDHLTMPTDEDGTELVCRLHKRHRPCRRCRKTIRVFTTEELFPGVADHFDRTTKRD